MNRQLMDVITDQLQRNRQMIFLFGPRQSGKTWIARQLTTPQKFFSWDNPIDRRLILENGRELVERAGLHMLSDELPVLVFDELHKFRGWKDFLKGFFDAWESRCRIVVTGSASMDAFSRGGDSLMGRYFPFRCHPFTWQEILGGSSSTSSAEENELAWRSLVEYGGFPEPYLRRDRAFWRRWKNLRWKQLLREDIRDLSRSLELDRIEVLAGILLEQAAGQCNWAALAARLQVAQDSLRRWVALLESLYSIFLVRPWSANIARSLVKEPKIYFTDWSWVADPGARAENLVASQIKACTELWQDRGLGDFGLWYLRDKDGREADFLVSRDGKPWMVLEVKESDSHFSPGFLYMARRAGAPWNFQIVVDLPPTEANPFTLGGIPRGSDPLVVSARSFFRDFNPDACLGRG